MHFSDFSFSGAVLNAVRRMKLLWLCSLQMRREDWTALHDCCLGKFLPGLYWRGSTMDYAVPEECISMVALKTCVIIVVVFSMTDISSFLLFFLLLICITFMILPWSATYEFNTV